MKIIYTQPQAKLWTMEPDSPVCQSVNAGSLIEEEWGQDLLH